MPTLYLIDGYAQFFRAYHAIRTPMSSPVTKEPTNMSFGFIGMLLKLLRGEGKLGGKPEYVAVTLDVSGDRGTFRSELYPDYKAHRPPPPEDLFPQVDRMIEMLKLIGVPVIGAEGYEADDVIATLVTAVRKARPDVGIRIVSKDKDLKQLLVGGGTSGEWKVESGDSDKAAAGAPVTLFDIHNDTEITAATWKEETGLTPAQVIDYLALMGDNVDNVPGVEGVGPKTAAQLIAEYGSLDAVVAEAAKEKSKITGKRLENIRAAAAQLPLSRQLVTLRHDAPATLELKAAEVSGFRLGELIPVLKTLGFNRYQDEVRALMGETVEKVGAAAVEKNPARRAGIPTEPGRSALMGPGAASSSGALFQEKSTPRQNPSPTPSLREGAFKARNKGADPLFGGLFDQASGDAPAAAPVIMAQSGEYRCVKTERELRELVEELRAAECISIDTETMGLAPLLDPLVGVCLSTRVGTGVYVPVRSKWPQEHLDEATVLSALRPVLEDPRIPKCGHNLKFDMLVLRRAGVRLEGCFAAARGEGSAELAALRAGSSAARLESTVFDSMVASFLIDADRSSHGMDSLALALLGRTNISIKELIGSGGVGSQQRTFDQVPLQQATQYAAEDADVALQLREKMLPQLTAMGLMPLFTGVEMPLVEVLAELEWNGIRVDRAELERQRLRLQKRIDELRKEIVDYTEDHLHRPFNPDSPKQLAAVLFNKRDATDEQGGPGFGLRSVKKIKTGHSTDAEVLEKLAEDPAISNPIPKLIVEHRELTKLVNTYLEALAEAIYPAGVVGAGRVHSSFNQTVAVTGRLASSDPNLQNIPIRTDVGREIRRAFIAEPGHLLISADYSQIELRLLAHLSRDTALIRAFHEGQDIHTAVAAQIHGVAIDRVTREQRNGAKMVNFGIVYGVTPFGLARRLGISNTAAEEIITGYKRRFPGITTFLQECIEQAKRHGYVQTMLGRRRPIPEIESRIPARRSFAERTAINSVVQGSAADLIKLAMVDVYGAMEGREPERGGGADGLGGSGGSRGASRAGGKTPLACAQGSVLQGSVKLLLQIHDELVFECAEEEVGPAARGIVEIMEQAMTLTVPLKADVRCAGNWFEGK